MAHRRVADRSVAAAPDDTHLVSCGTDRSVKVWDVGSRACVQTVADAHADQAWGVAFEPAGSRFCSVGDDKTIRVYDLAAA